ncbi:uncharacterized protein LOC117342551 [Pecten maximus]|uniref:uncharacterized protein LOC117342551 n=1 Tax=Pecten maximus TaxID=6579 RepID=UPI0014580118|nr:uncharacterized protein LOC117342551 [Pecten maximus]
MNMASRTNKNHVLAVLLICVWCYSDVLASSKPQCDDVSDDNVLNRNVRIVSCCVDCKLELNVCMSGCRKEVQERLLLLPCEMECRAEFTECEVWCRINTPSPV